MSQSVRELSARWRLPRQRGLFWGADCATGAVEKSIWRAAEGDTECGGRTLAGLETFRRFRQRVSDVHQTFKLCSEYGYHQRLSWPSTSSSITKNHWGKFCNTTTVISQQKIGFPATGICTVKHSKSHAFQCLQHHHALMSIQLDIVIRFRNLMLDIIILIIVTYT